MSLRFIGFILSLIVFSPAAVALAAESEGTCANDPAVVVVTSAQFGLIKTHPSKPDTFTPKRVVPLRVNQGYGWRIRLNTNQATVKWREEFTLPAKPKTWGAAEEAGSRAVSDDGRVSVTEREVTPDNGVIANTWYVAPGDPAGRYRIRVFVEGQLVKTFAFIVKRQHRSAHKPKPAIAATP